MLTKRLFGFLLLPLAACGTGPIDVRPADPDVVQSRTDLTEAFNGASDVDVVGVTVDPIDGQRYVLDSSKGIYRLDDGRPTLVAGWNELRGEDAIPQSVFTDLVALGDGRFALTALNDGFLYDSKTNRFSRYFCYVPGFIEDVYPMPVEQLTRSVTYDTATNKLYAQPQTFEEGVHDVALRSEVGRFDIDGGEGYGWMPMPETSFSAGGIAIGADGRMILGAGDTLYRMDLETGVLSDGIDLSEHGVDHIEALAVDQDHILVVDGKSKDLIELRLP